MTVAVELEVDAAVAVATRPDLCTDCFAPVTRLIHVLGNGEEWASIAQFNEVKVTVSATGAASEVACVTHDCQGRWTLPIGQ